MDTVIVYGRRGTTAHQDIPDTVKAEFDGVLSDIKIRQGKLEDAVIETLKNRSSDRGISFGGTMIRVCILGLVIFLVQIMMQLYRYNSRLIAFYGSRRDAILLAKGNAPDMEKYAKQLSPDTLDFGKEPNSFLQELLKFFSQRRSG